jgi:GT2 family glycosyltransferase
MKISVVIPTLAADEALEECLRSLGEPRPDSEILVVDNSGNGAADWVAGKFPHVRVVRCEKNLGYGGGINRGIQESSGEWVLALNDDTVVHTGCIDELLRVGGARRDIGMVAPRIVRAGTDTVDSAGGMLVAPDGTSKQRGQGRPAKEFERDKETLLPSGCAALYRREMLEETGGFEESYFLYCEDTDLGLRARWKAWECMYAAKAIVEHKYSHSSGAASALKAYYVERNRLRTVIRNFPLRDLLRSPWHTVIRYFWHLRYRGQGKGTAASYSGKESLPMVAWRAWKDTLFDLPKLLKQRRAILGGHTRLTPHQFSRLLRSNRITSRQVAEL